MKYRYRKTGIEAVQWDGSEEALEKIKELSFILEAEISGDCLMIIPADKFLPHIMIPNQMWVTDNGLILSDKDFQEQYVPVTVVD